MIDSLKPLLDSELINEETRTEINEAWERKLVEAKEQARAELREEFAQKYSHDKEVMVEALDRMITEGLSREIQEVRDEKQALASDRVQFKRSMSESATKFNKFMVSKLAEEISELRGDQQAHKSALVKLESFVIKALANEIREFAKDKRAVVETRVRLVREARAKLETLKAAFISESAKKMSRAVSVHLKAELSQLHEDIKVARENNFGRRIFEAYAAEFGATHLNEKAEIRKLHSIIDQKDQRLAESTRLIERSRVLVESKEREIRVIKESNERSSLMADLLAPLNSDKREVMRNLLESVQTPRLKSAFEKYLPAVLEDRSTKTKRQIVESVTEVTGDKSARSPQVIEDETDSNVIEIKRLAGL